MGKSLKNTKKLWKYQVVTTTNSSSSFAEFLGTMFLMLAVNWSSGGTTPQCVGLTVFMCA